ncbi:hypothetical protein ACLMJK_006222 [Lecanora helva]
MCNLLEARRTLTSPQTRKSLRNIVTRFLTRRPSAKEKTASHNLPDAFSEKEAVPAPRPVRREGCEEQREHRKSVIEIGKPMDGVGLATGNGDGDQKGVIIKDFAYVVEERPASKESSCVELE